MEAVRLRSCCGEIRKVAVWSGGCMGYPRERVPDAW
jgi:hypothetical protein